MSRPPDTVRIPDRLPRELVDRIEAWRTAQRAPPSKVRAIAYLLERGLAADASGDERR